MPTTASLEILKVLRQIIRAIDLHSRRLIQQHGVTVPQLMVLQALGDAGERSAGELAKDVQISQGTLTDLLIRLEGRGLVLRARGSDDRRRILVRLTEAGRDVVERAPAPLHDRFRAELNSLQEWERSQILATLQRVAAMLRADHLDAAPLLAPGPLGDAGHLAADGGGRVTTDERSI